MEEYDGKTLLGGAQGEEGILVGEGEVFRVKIGREQELFVVYGGKERIVYGRVERGVKIRVKNRMEKERWSEGMKRKNWTESMDKLWERWRKG